MIDLLLNDNDRWRSDKWTRVRSDKRTHPLGSAVDSEFVMQECGV